MEQAGTYYEPIVNALHNECIFVSTVNPLLIYDYGTNCVRKVKTDKKNSLKIASYALDKWIDLREYIPTDDIRKVLKIMNRQYIQCKKNHYNFSEAKTAEIHTYSKMQVSFLPMTCAIMKSITESAKVFNLTLETFGMLRNEMDMLSSQIPEYDTVMSLYGVDRIFCFQLIAEISDVRRLKHSKSIVPYLNGLLMVISRLYWVYIEESERLCHERLCLLILFNTKGRICSA